MKKLLTLCLLILSVQLLNAQNNETIYKPFRVDINMGFPVQATKYASVGFLFAIEPKYAIQDKIQIGLRMEGAVMTKLIDQNKPYESYHYQVAANASYLVTSDYYFSNKKFRPFAGIGLGFNRVYAVDVDVLSDSPSPTSYTFGAQTKFSSLIRTGFEFGHGRLGIEYNLIPTSTTTSNQNSTLSITNSYWALKLGVAIGGGRYKK